MMTTMMMRNRHTPGGRILPLGQTAQCQRVREASVVNAVKSKSRNTIFNLSQSTELYTRFLSQSDQAVFEAEPQATTKTTPHNSEGPSRQRDGESYIQQ